MKQFEKDKKIRSIFYPDFDRKVKKVRDKNIKFVQYTSAESAMKIIKNEEIWLRNVRYMNDYSEVEHGLTCLVDAFKKGGDDNPLKKAINRFYPNVIDAVASEFDAWVSTFMNDTSILCVSEHPSSEDAFGRLSMWRAYGGDCTVAIVFNINPFFAETTAIKAYTRPVHYLDSVGYQRKFNGFARRIAKETLFLNTLPAITVKNLLFENFRDTLFCVKHPGFKEEREWRVVYNPIFGKSDALISDIEVINGVPQQIYKIPLKNIPEKNFTGATVSEVIDHIILGPGSQRPLLGCTFASLLASKGVKNPESKISYSDIPIR